MELPDLTDPARLWWLLLLPVLYLLARPPFPRRVVDTAHMAQWLRAQQRLGRRRVRFRRLRFLLMVLAFTLSVVAFAGPRSRGAPGPTRLAVLLDSSASMGEATGSESPYGQAVALIRARLSTLPADIEVRLARIADQVEVSVGAAESILSLLEASPRGAGLVSLERLAEGLLDRDTAVWTLTDGLGTTRPPQLGALTILGVPGDNVGFVAGELTDSWPLPEVRVDYEIRSFAAVTRTVTVAVEGPVEPVQPAQFELPAGGARTSSIELRRTGAGLLRIHLQTEGDLLAADDQLAWQLPGPPAPVIAALADEESGPWLHAAAVALAEESGGTVVEGVSAAGFLLVEGGVMDVVPGRSRGLYFGTRPPGPPPDPRDLWHPVVVDWDRQDPLTAGLDLSDLRIDQALPRVLPAGKTLIRGERGPLMVVVEEEDRATVHTAFRMSDSNIGLLPAFPQLLRRSLSRAYGQPARPRPAPPRLLSAAESELRWAAGQPRNRPLPEFGRAGDSLVVPLLLLALVALAARVYT